MTHAIRVRTRRRLGALLAVGYPEGCVLSAIRVSEAGVDTYLVWGGLDGTVLAVSAEAVEVIP